MKSGRLDPHNYINLNNHRVLHPSYRPAAACVGSSGLPPPGPYGQLAQLLRRHYVTSPFWFLEGSRLALDALPGGDTPPYRLPRVSPSRVSRGIFSFHLG
jgi:hypothetical protein